MCCGREDRLCDAFGSFPRKREDVPAKIVGRNARQESVRIRIDGRADERSGVVQSTDERLRVCVRIADGDVREGTTEERPSQRERGMVSDGDIGSGEMVEPPLVGAAHANSRSGKLLQGDHGAIVLPTVRVRRHEKTSPRAQSACPSDDLRSMLREQALTSPCGHHEHGPIFFLDSKPHPRNASSSIVPEQYVAWKIANDANNGFENGTRAHGYVSDPCARLQHQAIDGATVSKCERCAVCVVALMRNFAGAKPMLNVHSGTAVKKTMGFAVRGKEGEVPLALERMLKREKSPSRTPNQLRNSVAVPVGRDRGRDLASARVAERIQIEREVSYR